MYAVMTSGLLPEIPTHTCIFISEVASPKIKQEAPLGTAPLKRGGE
jgi:hypothetical protein